MKRIIFNSIIFLFIPILSFSQINVSEVLQANNIVTKQESKLFLIDFWATWCGPCIHVNKYITVLQKQFPEDLYVLSLTKENPEVVKKFLVNHNTDLAVAIDYDGETFFTNSIYSIPEAILLNSKGERLWKGHPAELKYDMIKDFIRSNSHSVSIDNIIYVKNTNEETAFVNYIPNSNFELLKSEDAIGFNVDNLSGYQKIQGSLEEIFSYLLSVHEKQLTIESLEDNYITVYFKNDEFSNNEKVNKISENLGLKLLKQKQNTEVVQLQVKQNKLWDTFQIDWEGASQYLIGESEIQADNISLNEMSYILSKAMDKPVVVKDSKSYLETKHDWQFHYKYYELMQADLLDNFGIEVSKENKEITKYKVTKKAP